MKRDISGGETGSWLRRGLGAIAAAAFVIVACGSSAAEGLRPEDGKPVKRKTVKPVAIYHLDVENDRIDVRITLHKSENVRVAYPFSDALIGNAEIADVVPLTNESINILGKKIGVTRLSLLDPKKQVLGIVDIEVTHDVETLRRVMRDTPSFASIHVEAVYGRIMLTGVAPDSVVMSRALALAEQFAPGEVTNAMTVAAPQQVMLEVRFVEASRSLSRGLGITPTIGNNRFGATTGVESLTPGSSIVDSSQGGVSTNAISNLASGIGSGLTPFGAAVGRVFGGSTQVDITIKALEEQGLARKLAEPNLVALSGDTASFLAGGEYPFPVAGSNNTVTTEFKKFGIGLAFTPTVLAGRQINLKIEPEVSEIDTSVSVNVNGVSVPGLSVRRASTTVELRDGQSFAIAGLLQGSHTADTRQLPWVGDVPVLGALMRSSSFQKQETDLVIIVTPRLVRPQIPGDKQATPLDNRKPANDVELFFGGRQEVPANKPPQTYAGHILDIPPGPQVGPGYGGSK